MVDRSVGGGKRDEGRGEARATRAQNFRKKIQFVCTKTELYFDFMDQSWNKFQKSAPKPIITSKIVTMDFGETNSELPPAIRQ